LLERDSAQPLVEHAVEQEDGRAGVERAGEHRQDQARPAWEGVGEVEARDEDEGAADSHEQVRDGIGCVR